MGSTSSVPACCDDELCMPCNPRTWVPVGQDDSSRKKTKRPQIPLRNYNSLDVYAPPVDNTRHPHGALHPSSAARTLVPCGPPELGYLYQPYPVPRNNIEVGNLVPMCRAEGGGGGSAGDYAQDEYGNWYLNMPVHDFAHDDPAYCYPQSERTMKQDTNAARSARTDMSMATTACSVQQPQPTNVYSDLSCAAEPSHVMGGDSERNEAVSEKLSAVHTAFHTSTSSRIYDDERSEPRVSFSANGSMQKDAASRSGHSGRTAHSMRSGHISRTSAYSGGAYSGHVDADEISRVTARTSTYTGAAYSGNVDADERSRVPSGGDASEQHFRNWPSRGEDSRGGDQLGGVECGDDARTRSLVDVEIGRFALNDKLCAECAARHGAKVSQEGRSSGICTQALQYFETELAEMRRLPSTFCGFTFHAVEFSTAAVYAGWWNYRQRHGYGLHTWRDGSYYVGDWAHNCAEGLGMFARSCGTSYIGQWVANQARGLGHSKTSEDTEFCGVWEANELHGVGIEVSKKGHHYYGQFSHGVKDGVGRCMWDDGSHFDGEWRNNTISGLGTYVTCDGRIFRGEWENSEMHGMGIYAWSDGRSYRGEYRHDVKHGFGILEFPDGRSYEGLWDNGVQHGLGRVTTADGRSYRAMWSYGARVRIIEDSP
eukprot:GEMP01003552.1.p1 GENE.GEMP01003552.1~~GEMP01003552.1.p1  ORF type:complete len:654 (+),score=117.01 GEMP01003552.1:428-2389(+)